MSARNLGVYLALGTWLAGCAHPTAHPPSNESLTFVRDGRTVMTLSLADLAAHAPPSIVTTDDPYYGRHKRFRAMSLDAILQYAYGEEVASLRRHAFVLHARDGYAVPVEGRRLLEGGAYLAYDDVEHPGFAPIGPQHVSPAPAYLIWNRTGQSNLETHPRPWQLTSIEIASFESLYPHTVPTESATDSDAMRGFALFRVQCIRCHAINREGGHVGPDLNVPRSITEYRPEAQIREFIVNPAAFRYSAMPAHPDLSNTDLDGLVAYLRAMAALKHDTEASGAP